MKLNKCLALLISLNFVFCYQNLFSEKIYILANPTNFIVGEIAKGETEFNGKKVEGLGNASEDFNIAKVNSYKHHDSDIWIQSTKKIEKIDTISLEFQDGTIKKYLIDEDNNKVNNLKDDIVGLADWANDQVIFPRKATGYGFEFFKRPAYQIFSDDRELADDIELVDGMELVFGIKNEKWDMKLIFLDDANKNIVEIPAKIMHLDTVNWLKYQIAIMLGIEYDSETYRKINIKSEAKEDFKDLSKSFQELGYDKKTKSVCITGLNQQDLASILSPEKIFLDWGTAASLTHEFIITNNFKAIQDAGTTKLIQDFAKEIVQNIMGSEQIPDKDRPFIDGMVRDAITAYLLGKLLYLKVKPNNMETIQEQSISVDLKKISTKIIEHNPEFSKLKDTYETAKSDINVLVQDITPKIIERIKLILDLAVEFGQQDDKTEDAKMKIASRIFDRAFSYEELPENLANCFVGYYNKIIGENDSKKILSVFHFSWIPDIYKGANSAVIRSAPFTKESKPKDIPLIQKLSQLRNNLAELKIKLQQLTQKLETLKSRL